MSIPTSGPASEIIAQAIHLGILCRPMHSERFGLGCALEPTKDGCFFHRVCADGPTWSCFVVEPREIICDWELTTMDILQREEAESSGTF